MSLLSDTEPGANYTEEIEMIRTTNRRTVADGLTAWDMVDEAGRKVAMLRTSRFPAPGRNVQILWVGGGRGYAHDHLDAIRAFKAR